MSAARRGRSITSKAQTWSSTIISSLRLLHQSCIDLLLRCLQVAKCIVKGAARREYHIHGPDVGLNILVASMAGFSPRAFNWLFEIVLAPILVLLANVAIPLADRIVRKHRAAAAAGGKA